MCQCQHRQCSPPSRCSRRWSTSTWLLPSCCPTSCRRKRTLLKRKRRGGGVGCWVTTPASWRLASFCHPGNCQARWCAGSAPLYVLPCGSATQTSSEHVSQTPCSLHVLSSSFAIFDTSSSLAQVFCWLYHLLGMSQQKSSVMAVQPCTLK